MNKKQIILGLLNEIAQGYEDLAIFHTNTFEDIDLSDYAEMGEDKDQKVGKAINDYIQDMDMWGEEDACYIVGLLDGYKRVIKLLQKTK